MVLATITASLANFLKLPESDISLLDIMGEGDEQHNLEDDKVAAAESVAGTSDTSVTSASTDKRIPLPTASSSRPHSKKKVAESWDDEAADDDANGSAAEAENEGEGNGRSVEELERGFKNVYKAFSKLRYEYDTKFRAMFA
jgi:ATP-dependent RNA helicase DDX60